MADASGMAINIGYKQFPEFNIRNDPETVYARFIKYADRFKNNNLKAYNITDKAQQRSLFLDSIGEATLDIFEQLGDTGTRYEISSRNRRTSCTIYTSSDASNRKRTKAGIPLSGD